MIKLMMASIRIYFLKGQTGLLFLNSCNRTYSNVVVQLHAAGCIPEPDFKAIA